MKISACWIVKNGESVLGTSIMSVRDCAAELIVVDTGSSDDTVRIAKEHGARVEHFEWVNDFSAARNYALSLVAGDYIIFLDADEYFEPALLKADRHIISDVFRDTDAETLQVNRIELDSSTGKVMGSEPHARIMRRTAVHYINRIHELPVNKAGIPPVAHLLENYRLMHTGYSADLVMEKYRRNINYLEIQQEELKDEFGLFHNHAYLMREYMAMHNCEKAFVHCRYLLDHYEQWNYVCATFSPHYIQRFYIALSLVGEKRFWFSRKEVYKKLIQAVKEIYSGYREAQVLGLYYQMLADYRGDRFLRELEQLEEMKTAIPMLDGVESRNTEAIVYGFGALEAYYRRNFDKARHLADRALHIMPEYNSETMTAVRNQSFEGDDSPISREILKGDYERAYMQLEQEFKPRPLDTALLQLLLIIAEQAGTKLKKAAGKQYHIRRALLDEAIDLSDVVNTGYVDNEEVKAQTQGLRDISFEQLTNILEEDRVRPMTADILTLHGLAAPIYEKKGLPVTALRSHLLLFVKNQEPKRHRQELIRLLREQGNALTADQFATLRLPEPSIRSESEHTPLIQEEPE